MSIVILDSATATACYSAPSQTAQMLALAEPFGTGNITAKIYNGTTLLDTCVHAPWSITSNSLSIGNRVSRSTAVATGPATKIVFAAGSTDIFSLTAATSPASADWVFAANISLTAATRLSGLTITANGTLPLTTPLSLVSNSPASVEIWNYTNSSSPTLAGTIPINTLIKANRFADAALNADCHSWLEYGAPEGSSPVIMGGIQFGAVGFDIPRGGVYTERSYRVFITMRCVAMADGIFGDPRGVNHFPPPHKIRIKSLDGTLLKTIEMRDGLPINDPSLINIPAVWTVTERRDLPDFPILDIYGTPGASGRNGYSLSDNTAMRPYTAAGASYIAFFGDTPDSSAANRNRIPRVNTSLWKQKGQMFRSVYNGEDFHIHDKGQVSGNGNMHTEAMQQWPLSFNQAIAITNIFPNLPATAYTGNATGSNWLNATAAGWDYEPGAVCNITRRGGPGGIRSDRTTLPVDQIQMYLTQPTRSGDGTSTAAMARGFAMNMANYPCYYAKDMRTLDPIDTFSTLGQPNIPGRDIHPVAHYYGSTPGSLPNDIWTIDSYGTGTNATMPSVEASMPGTGAAMTTGKGHVRNGWSPDAEHNNRMGNHWSTLLYADPMFAKMSEHILLEVNLMNPTVSRGTWGVFGKNVTLARTNLSLNLDGRPNILPLIAATMQWWVATETGTYTRSAILERLLAYFADIKTDILDNLGTPTTSIYPAIRALNLNGGYNVVWQSWTATNNYSAGSGWVMDINLSDVYKIQWFLMLKASGLYSILKSNATAAAVLAVYEKRIECIARMFTDAPSAYMQINAPYVVLRRADQGALESDLSTIPTSIAQAISFNPPIRGDQYWFLGATDTPGVAQVVGEANYASYGRMNIAHMWWKYMAPAGSERTAKLAATEALMATINNYTPDFYSATYCRFNYTQDVPALNA